MRLPWRKKREVCPKCGNSVAPELISDGRHRIGTIVRRAHKRALHCDGTEE